MIAILAFGATALADGPGCADGNSCAWNQQFYNGTKRIMADDPGEGWKEFGNRKYSAKNRFLSFHGLAFGAFGPSRDSCLNPQQNDPSLNGGAGAKYFKVLSQPC